jgi:uncharacterized cupredoxin-like copper-binding protein
MRWISAVAASLAVLTAACNDRELEYDAEPATEQSGEVSSEALIEEGVAVVEATLSEWKIALSRDSIPAGPVAFQIRNSGSAEHAFEVEGAQADGEFKSDPLAAGETVTMSMNLKPGIYEVYCPLSVDGTTHRQAGMRTRLRVY